MDDITLYWKHKRTHDVPRLERFVCFTLFIAGRGYKIDEQFFRGWAHGKIGK